MRFLSFFIAFFLPAAFFAQRVETTILRGVSDGKIKKYETIEIGLRVPEKENAYRNFLFPPGTEKQVQKKNPFTEKFLRLQFTCHGKTYTIPAFYMQDAAPDEKANRYVLKETVWPWRVRFAVPDTGNWQCVVLIGENPAQAIPKNAGIYFECIPGNNHGYLNVAPDRRHFRYTDGTMFFAIGQNIAWADEPVLHGHDGPPPVYAGGYYDVYHYINNLADNGANYVRMVMIYWSTGIEWNEIGMYDQTKACALDSMIALAEKRGLKVHLCMNMSGGMNRGTPVEAWSQYRKRFLGVQKTAIELFKDSTALSHMDNFIRYVHARWTYSPAVATIELLGEGNGAEGYDEHETYYADFYFHARKLLREEFGDTMHMLSTSSSNTDHPEMYTSDAISFIDMHHYDNNFKCNQKRYRYIQRNSKKMDKPFLFGEMGMTNGPGNNADADDFEHCNGISFHNAAWATAFMGAAGTGMNWWQWKFDVNRETTINSLSYFLDSLMSYVKFSGEPGMWTGNGLECFYQQDKYGPTYGWIHNTSYWWGNMMQDCRDRHGNQMAMPKDDDRTAVPEKREGNEFRIGGFDPGKSYYVTFYDTRSRNKWISSISLRTNRLGVLKIPFPGGSDYAFRILRAMPGKF